MTEAKSGDLVRIHYTGMLSDGTPFDSTRDREPMEFELGAGQVLPGLEARVVGMSVGEAQTVTVPAEEAFGPRDPNKIQTFSRQEMPANLAVEPGMRLQARSRTGEAVTVSVVDVSDADVTVDANHPLAGRDLTFEIELQEIVKAA
ncbi:peptidylprolyl isomerase [Rhizobium sp. TRM95111]|uniref:FKBP-type peptidyl-prolyl cis-trans isomerase n=1 Tax=Rhizobium alarense TaxID=2846851 RepID=UPI001F28589D|nr:peptidylprolyl isomerase [Rhizobium alarense]MCF3642152.1 peptidylprolyl isomerase [Rhizobium alarense]